MSRLLRLYRWANVPPEGVDKAPRRERWKRQAWMFLSTIIAAAIATAGVYLYWELFGIPGWWGQWGLLIGYLFTFFVIDIRLFGWGLRKFDLIPPWQFRVDAEGRD